MFLEIILIGICLFLHIAYVKYQRRNWPPGPFPYPLIGNLVEVLWTNTTPYIAFHKLAEKYGNVFIVKLGVVDTVILNGYKEFKEIHLSDSINHRFGEEWLLDRCYGSDKYGLFFSNVHAWKPIRRFTQTSLKDFGFGKRNAMNELICEEFQTLVERIETIVTDNAGILKIDMTFHTAFTNIIHGCITGTRFDQDDPKLKELVMLSNEWFQASKYGSGALGAWPFLKNWAPELSGFSLTHNSNIKLLKYFEDLVDSVRSNGPNKNNPENFIEIFLQRMEVLQAKGINDDVVYTEKNLVCILNDLFTAGSDTSANTLSFAIRRLVQNPQVQAKIQMEVKNLGNRNISLADRDNLTYTEAFLLEVLRIDNTGPLTGRRANEDCKYGDFIIPKGVHVLSNMYSANRDKRIWLDPEEFRPERFLDSNGNITNEEKLVSFGFGKRDCIGQTISKNSLLMAIAYFAQNFTFQVDASTGMPGHENSNAMTVAPMPFNSFVKINK